MNSNPEHTIKTLFDEHFHQLVLYAFRFTKDTIQAEEIVQDIFVKIWQNFDQVSHVTDFRPYLYKAVKNSCLNYLRHLKIRQKYQVDTVNSQDHLEIAADESHDNQETFNRLNEAVNKLPEHWKDAIVLSKYDKLKYNEIAEKMNISQKTVEKYISKALRFLRSELKDLLITILILKLL